MSFTRRRINLTFALGQGDFGNGGFDTLTFEGLRVSASITKTGGVSMSQVTLRVFGMSLTDMNRISTLGKPLVSGRNNRLTIQAGDDETGVATVFIGTISEAWTDMAEPANPSLSVQAFSGLLDAFTPAVPRSYPGTADVKTIMAGLATEMGYAFEDGGVDVQLANPYFPGTPRQQAQACAQAANINWVIDDGTLAIWPVDGSRKGLIPKISAGNGLVAYPTHTQNGIVITTLFNPSIVYGGQVEIESDLTPANGTWTVFSVSHTLQSETPDGEWFTRMECSILGFLPLST